MKAGEPLRFYFFQGEEDRQRGSKVNEEEEDEAGAFEPAAYLATCLFGLARTRLECLGSTWGVPLDPVTQTSSRRSAYQCGQATAGDRFSRKETPSVRMIGEAQGAAADFLAAVILALNYIRPSLTRTSPQRLCREVFVTKRYGPHLTPLWFFDFSNSQYHPRGASPQDGLCLHHDVLFVSLLLVNLDGLFTLRASEIRLVPSPRSKNKS